MVTAMDENGNPIGFTANSFTSVSLDPPLLLICVDNSSDHIETYRNGSGFMVNILADNQKKTCPIVLHHRLKTDLKGSIGRKVTMATLSWAARQRF